MGEHSTEKSIVIIEFIKSFGKYMNYYVSDEFPLKSNSFGGQAIDIAWFNDKSSTFPLFIFEIESTTNNSIINNPSKIYGKDSKDFEKPLFFFHIIIDGAETSEKYGDLLGLFGKHNYDIFKLNRGDLNLLLLKVFAQHRRIRDDINLQYVIELILETPEVFRAVDLDLLLPQVENIVHENQFYWLGQVYANVASKYPCFENQYKLFIERLYLEKSLRQLIFEGYSESITSELINLGIFFHSFGGKYPETDYEKLLEDFQNRHDFFQSIQYLPGLNQDYQIFVEDYVPYYLALAFRLFEGNTLAQEFILKLCIELLRVIPQNEGNAYEHHLSWALLLSSSNKRYYDFYEQIINLNGPENLLTNTILFEPQFRNDHVMRNETKLIPIPEIDIYLNEMKSRYSIVKANDEILHIAISSLTDNPNGDLQYQINLGVGLANMIIKSNENKNNSA